MRSCGKLLSGLALVVVLLVGASVVFADATERVTNGGFESGSGTAAPPWTFSSAQACDATTCAFSAASGSRYAATSVTPEQAPAFSLQTIGHLEQNVVVPESPATLTFQLRSDQSGGSIPVELVIKLNGTMIGDINDAAAFPTTFQKQTITIPPAQVSPDPQLLEFTVNCNNLTNATHDCWGIDLDDISIVTGSAPAAPTISATDPASPSSSTHPLVKGTLGAGSPTQIKIFTNAGCSGSPSATGTAADFTGAGIGVDVPANATTSLSASATNLAGDSGCSNVVTYVNQPVPTGGSPNPEPQPTPTTTPPDTTPPSLTALRVNPNAFTKNAKLSYTLSEAATVTFKLERVATGRKVGKRCKAARSARKGRACTYFAPVAGTLSKAGTAGKNSRKLTKTWKGHKLAKGSYRLTVQAKDAAGNVSKAVRASFRIKR